MVDGETDVPLTVPLWADFFDTHQYTAFLTVLDDELDRRGWAYELDESAVVVLHDATRYGLVDLAKKCLQSQKEPERWHILLRDHFDSLARSGTEMAELEQMTFEEVRDLLRVRLYPPGLATKVGRARLVLRELAPCLDEVLVADLPSVVVTVKPEIVERWGRDLDQLFALARDNVRREDVQHERVELEDAVVIDLWEGESHFVASRVLVLDLDPNLAPYGALVALPNRHTLAAHVIGGFSTQAEATRVMLGWLSQAHREGPGSISPHIYWLTPDRKLLQFDATDSAQGQVLITPPQRFVDEVLVPLSMRAAEPGN